MTKSACAGVEHRRDQRAARGSIWIVLRNFTGSPASLILAIVLLIVVFVAPFGIVGLLKRLAAKVVVIVPSPAGRATDESQLLVTTEADAAIEEGRNSSDQAAFADPFTNSGEPT